MGWLGDPWGAAYCRGASWAELDAGVPSNGDRGAVDLAEFEAQSGSMTKVAKLAMPMRSCIVRMFHT